MPKDPAENIDRYKIRGGQLNRFEFQQNQEALATERSEIDSNLIPGTPPEQRSKQLIQKTTAPAKSATKTGAKHSSKKLTGKSASKKTSAKKASAKKSVKAKKGQPTSMKKSRAKKASAKKRSRK